MSHITATMARDATLKGLTGPVLSKTNPKYPKKSSSWNIFSRSKKNNGTTNNETAVKEEKEADYDESPRVTETALDLLTKNFDELGVTTETSLSNRPFRLSDDKSSGGKSRRKRKINKRKTIRKKNHSKTYKKHKKARKQSKRKN